MSPEVADHGADRIPRPQPRARCRRSAAEKLAELAARTTKQFTEQSDPFYATARLWDDGIIEPQRHPPT